MKTQQSQSPLPGLTLFSVSEFLLPSNVQTEAGASVGSRLTSLRGPSYAFGLSSAGDGSSSFLSVWE